jgi:hypothetical protein
MATRSKQRLLAFAPAVIGVAVVLWLGARAWLAVDETLESHPVEAATAAPPARPTEGRPPAAVAVRPERGAAIGRPASAEPPAPASPSWDASFRGASDYFAFAQSAARAAIAGDGRAQYLLGQALLACDEQIRPILSMQRGSAAANTQAYLALIPDRRTQDQVLERLRPCEGFFQGSPLEGLTASEDERSASHWLERARESNDALAVMDRAIEESKHQHSDTIPPEHRAELLGDVRVAVASRDPAALFKISEVYSQATIARDTTQGAAWLVAACAAGYDCSYANPAVGQGCADRGICDARAMVTDDLRRDGRFAEIEAAGRDILARVEQGDWKGLQPYLATND